FGSDVDALLSRKKGEESYDRSDAARTPMCVSPDDPVPDPGKTRDSGARSAGRLKQLVQRDRQIAYPFAGGVVDGVRQRARNTGNADFADAARAERIELLVILVD